MKETFITRLTMFLIAALPFATSSVSGQQVTQVLFTTSQSGPITYGTPETVTYQISVRYKNGTNGTYTVDLSIAGLPSGVTASFNPATLSYTDPGNGGKNATTTLSITSSTHAPATPLPDPFTVTASPTTNTDGRSSASSTLTIDRKPVTVSVTAANKVYDGTKAAAITSKVVNDVVGSDDVSFDIGLSEFSDKNTGTGKTVTASALLPLGTSAMNYTLPSSATTTADITPKTLTITAAGADKPYDGTTTATVSLSDDRVSGDDLTTAYTSAVFDNENAGNDKPISVTGITVSGTDAGNYSHNTTASATADVTAIELTVTANAGQGKVYGSSDPVLTYQVSSGLVGSDQVSGALGRNTGEDVGAYAYTLGTLTAGGNYNLSLASTDNFQITQKDLTITPNAGQQKTYGQPDPSLTYQVSNDLVGTDQLTGSLARDAGENVGNYAITLGSLTAGGNYNILFTSGVNFSIIKAVTSISAGDLVQLYDGTPKAVSASTPELGTTGISVTYNGSATAPSDPGDYTVVASLSDDNYSAPDATFTFSILSLIGVSGPTTFCQGGSVTLTAYEGTGYQWSLNSSPIPGATGQTYIAASGGNYTVETTTGTGVIKSTIVPVTVNPLPDVPTVGAGGPTTFCDGDNVTLTGPAADGHLWYKDGVAIPGANGSSYVATATGNYTLEVSNSFGCTATSAATSVLVHPVVTPTVSISASATTICGGTPVTFTAAATNEGDIPAYQWKKNGVNISGATASAYTTSTLANGDAIRCVLTSNAVCTTSPTATSNTITITVVASQAPPTPGTITGAAIVCPGDVKTYSIAPVLNAISYIWTAPANATITSGQGTTSVTVQFGNPYTTSTLSVRASNCVGNSAAKTLSVALKAKPTTPGTITGAAIVCREDEKTYSIAAVTGAVSYNWTAPANALITSGQGSTSVTVKFGAAYTTGNLSVTASNCGGTSAAKTLSVALKAKPATPGTISGAISVCPGNVKTYSIAAVTGADSYNWTAPANALITSGQGSTSVTVEFGAAYTTGNLSVTASNCGGTSLAKTLSVALQAKPAIPGTITGALIVCPEDEKTYSIAAVPGADSYSWTAPANALITSGQGTTSVTIQFSSSYTSGNVSVAATNCAGNGAARTLTVARKAKPATPGTITGTTPVCAGDVKTYSIAAVTGADSYNWTAPANALITSGQGSTTVTVEFGAAYTTGNLSVTASNCGGTSLAKTLSVALKAKPAQPGAITGLTRVCRGEEKTYSITAVTGADSYNWVAPANSSITSGQGSTTVTVLFNNSFTTGTLSVTATNCSGTGVARTLSVSYSKPAQPGVISGPATPVCTGNIYSIAPVLGATTYIWTVPAGATITSGEGSTSITMDISPAFTGGTLSVIASNCAGNSTARTLALSGANASGCSIAGAAPAEATEASRANGLQVKATLHTFSAHYTVSIKSGSNQPVQVRVFNVLGHLVEMKGHIAPNTAIQIGSQYRSGTYLVEVIQGNERQVVKLLK